METTTLILGRVGDENIRRARELLEEQPGVARVLARADKGEVYVRHSAARAPREHLLERLESEGLDARVKGT